MAINGGNQQPVNNAKRNAEDAEDDEDDDGHSIKRKCPLCGNENVPLASHLPKCDERNPPEGFDNE